MSSCQLNFKQILNDFKSQVNGKNDASPSIDDATLVAIANNIISNLDPEYNIELNNEQKKLLEKLLKKNFESGIDKSNNNLKTHINGVIDKNSNCKIKLTEADINVSTMTEGEKKKWMQQ